MKKTLCFLFMALSLSQGFAQQVSESEKKSVVTDEVNCKGDIFCVDKMRVVCDKRKSLVNSVYDLTAEQTDGDLHREDVKVEAILRKNGKGQDQAVSDVKKVECMLNVSSADRTWLFRETVSEKMKDTNQCRALMDKNIASGKRILFQQMQEGKTILFQKFCKVYLLELIKK